MSGWKGKIFAKSKYGFMGTSTDTGLDLLQECIDETLEYTEQNPGLHTKVSHDLCVYESVGYDSQATILLLQSDERFEEKIGNHLKEKIFSEREYSVLCGESGEAGLRLLEKCFSNAIGWINARKINSFMISHDINTYKSFGAFSVLVSIVILHNAEEMDGDL